MLFLQRLLDAQLATLYSCATRDQKGRRMFLIRSARHFSIMSTRQGRMTQVSPITGFVRSRSTLLALAAVAGGVVAATVCSAGAHAAGPAPLVVFDAAGQAVTLQAGAQSLQKWRMPLEVPAPANNKTTAERAALGRALFYDPRVSVHGRTSCASCHDPARGMGDGVPGSVRFMGEIMNRNSPTIFNSGFVSTLMWDGRNGSLEQQAHGSQSPTGSTGAGAKESGLDVTDPVVVNAGVERVKGVDGYRGMFERAYPGEPISKELIAKALAAFERTVVSERTPFDRWVAGDSSAMTPQQIRGFGAFVSASKGNCAVCHAPPHFSDGGFHNIGVPGADVGRFKELAVASMRGAFRTPSLREVAETAPYFHDGSAKTLADVVDHYARGGVVRDNISPLMKPLPLTAEDKADLVAFMKALTSPADVYERIDRPQPVRSIAQ
jgi:cytochrome c peroxidase